MYTRTLATGFPLRPFTSRTTTDCPSATLQDAAAPAVTMKMKNSTLHTDLIERDSESILIFLLPIPRLITDTNS